MSKRTKIRLIKYGSCFLFVLLSAAMYVLDRCTGDVNMTDWSEWVESLRQAIAVSKPVEWYQWICDGLTLPSVLLLSSGILIWVSNAGALDFLGYSGRFIAQLFLPATHKRYGTYGDYVLERKDKRVKGYAFLLISGAVSMGLTLLFLGLYFAAA